MKENSNMTADKRFSSGSKNLDALLGGGFEYGVITQLYGASGTGKTNICIQLAVQCVKDKARAVIIDTEGFSAERFSQIAAGNAKELAKNLILYEPRDFQQQNAAINEIEKLADTGIQLVILDSATLFYRLGLQPDEDCTAIVRRQLVEQLASLHRLARKFNMVVVITNQVYSDVKTGELRPLGGNLIEHMSKTIIRLDWTGKDRRKATLIKHRSRGERESTELTITGEGIQ